MTIGLIAGIIIFGLLIIMADIFLIPGTAIVGIIGGVIVIIGISLAYAHHGARVGNITLAVSTAASGVLMYVGYRMYVSRRFSLNEVVDSKVEVPEENLAKVGDEGVTVSFLRPNGKALLNNNKVEVYSQGEYIESGKKIKVVKIAEKKIFVKLNEN